MKIKLSIFICVIAIATISLSAQSTFDQRVDDLFFIQEIGFLLSADTTFSNLHNTKCKPGPCLAADFLFNPVLHPLKDTAQISFSFYDSVRVFTIRRISILYEDSDQGDFDQQFTSLYDYFNEISYMTEEQADLDIYPGEQFIFYGDKKAYSTTFPRVSLHSNFYKGKNGKPGHFTLEISLTEEPGK